MSRPVKSGDLTRRCSACGLSYLVTSTELARDSAANVERQNECPGCLALDRLCQRHSGTVVWYDPRKGYGFVENDQGQRLFVHRSAIVGAKRLVRGRRVDYRITSSERGVQAVDVTVTG